MPKFKYTLANGKTLTLEGDTQPSDEEVESIAKEQGMQLQPISKPSPEPIVDTSLPEYAKPTPIVAESEPEDDRGFFGKTWSALSEPLTDLPSRFARQVSESVTMPSPEADDSYLSQLAARAKGFAGGAIEGIGDLVSGLTSPINLVTTALTAGQGTAIKAGLPQIARAMNIGAKISAVPGAIHGAGEVIDPESSLQERGMGLAEMAGSGAAFFNPIPSVKPKSTVLTKQTIEPEIIPPGKINPILDDTATRIEVGEKIPNYNERAENGAVWVDNLYGKGYGGYADETTLAFIEDTAKRKGKASAIDVTPEVIPQAEPKYKMGTNVIIKSNKATPILVKKAREQGFEFEGLNDQGDFRFKKTSEPSPQPVLESEVGQARPKRSSITEGHIGELTDVKKSSIAAEAINFPRAVMASMDMSAPLRQGLPLIHKKEFWKAIPGMFKSWGSEEAFRQIQQSISEKPLFKPRAGPGGKTLPSFAEDAGLKLTDLTDLNSREEALMSTWAEKVPGVRRSNRAYTGFLNKLRADTFEALVSEGKVFGANSEVDIPLARALADFVNTASGRGSLGKLESSAVALNSTFFAPRLIASRLKMLNPAYYVMAHPQVRKEALKSLFSVAAAGNIVGQLGKMAGGTVEADPTSSDFGKLKVGNIRVDPFAGFQQYIVAANRLIQGRTKSSTTGQEYNLGEKFGRPTRLDVVGRFAESKLNPVLSFATGLLRGKDFTGQPFNIPEEISSRFVPIILQDLKQLATENPNLIPYIHEEGSYQDFEPQNLPFAIPAFFGSGIQQY